jgi:hypothetical protein
LVLREVFLKISSYGPVFRLASGFQQSAGGRCDHARERIDFHRDSFGAEESRERFAGQLAS